MANKRTTENIEEVERGAPLRYVGDGEYIPGVPARDLTVEEAALYATRIGASEAATGRILYQKAKGGEE